MNKIKEISKKYILTDLVMIIYLLSIGLLLSVTHKNVENWQTISTVYIIVSVILIFALPFWKCPKNQIMKFARVAFPLIITSVFYKDIQNVMFSVFPNYLDGFFLKLDKFVFAGISPSYSFFESFSSPIMMEIMSFFYASYYFQIFLTALLVFLWGKEFYRIVFGLSFSFYLCYLIFSILPVRGPLFFYDPIGLENGLAISKFLKLIIMNGDIPGAAFPSSHCALSVLATIYTIKYNRKFGFISLFLSTGLVISTVYLRQHYAVDAIAGVLSAIGCFYLAEYLFSKFSRNIKI